jgi:Domain of unknown function (DUF4191)
MARNTPSTSNKPGTSNPSGADAPKAPRFARLRQVGAALQQARQLDPRVVWWMLGSFLLVVTVFVGVGLAIGHPLYLAVLGTTSGVLVALIVMARRAERAAYGRLAGQTGGSGAALGALRRGWYHDQQPVAADAARAGDLANTALVFRAVGRPGVVLVLEGPAARAIKLGEKERKRVSRVLPNVPVTTLRVGAGEGEVPVRKLVGKINRMRPVLTKTEVSAVHKRLIALGGGQPPVPKGIDPTRARPDRRGMRGR